MTQAGVKEVTAKGETKASVRFDSGLQADLRTCALLGVHGLAAVTAVTVQNSVGVKGFHKVPEETIAAQLCQFARTNFVADGVEFDENSPLARAGIDSFALVELLLYCERTLGVRGGVVAHERALPEKGVSVWSVGG